MANKKTNSVKVGVAATAIGAALGAAAIALSDEKNRKKVTKKMQELQVESGKQLHSLEKKTQPMLDQVKSVFKKSGAEKEVKKAVKKTVEKVKESKPVAKVEKKAAAAK